MGEMHEKSDAQLLREYADHANEAAFREIVNRHAGLVYSSALRQVTSPDLARDVAQAIFTDLARKAPALTGTLTENSSLLGWLYRSTRFTALNLLRDDRRRLARERQVMEHFDPASETTPDWDQVQPVLDEAMADLSDEDRDALLLRFFKNHDFRAIGSELGVSDDAAQKRVSRALERLRTHLTSRGVTTSAIALSTTLSANAAPLAPAGLAAALSTSALAGTTIATAATAATIKTIAMTTLQKTLITATVAALTGAGIYEARQAAQLREQNQTLQQQQAPLVEQNQTLQRERDAATNRLVGLLADNSQLKSNPNQHELLKLRGEVGRLRQETAEANTPVTQDEVAARYQNAQELARSGDSAAALKEFLWCFDKGMPGVSSYAGVRTSFLLSSIAQLGEKYPSALVALRERRDKASQRMLNGENDSAAVMDFAAINRTLKEDQITLTVFDQLPAEDRRRQTLASAAYNQLVEVQRYGDALLGRPYATISAQFEMGMIERPLPANIANPEKIRKSQRDRENI